MTATGELTDVGRHLDQQIQELLTRKMQLLQASGYRPIEGCAIALSSAQSLLRVAMGMWLAQVPAHKRESLFDDTLSKMMDDTRRSAPSLLATLRAFDGAGV